MRIHKTIIFVILLTPLFFFSSYILIEAYTEGDQRHYRTLYDALMGAPYSEVMPLALRHVSGREPLSAFVLWAGANLGIDKDVYIAFLSAILLVGVFLLLRAQKVPWFVIWLVLTNFYLLVLMTGAERLKIAYILLVYAALIRGRWSVVLAIASPLAHLQSFIFLIATFLARYSGAVRQLIVNTRLSKRFLAALMGLVILIGAIGIYLYEQVLVKGTGYMERHGGLAETFQILLLFTVALLVTRERFKLTLSLAPLFGAAAVLGGLRVNMIAVTVVLYILLMERRLDHPVVVLLLAYFSVKSVFFIKNIFDYGNGFGGFLL